MPPAGDPAINYVTAEYFAPLAQLRANDLYLASGENRYYALIVRCTSPIAPFSVGDVGIVIRGTLSAIEWLDDAAAIIPTQNPRGVGLVGDGFWQLYASLTLHDLTGAPIHGPFFETIIGLAKGADRLFVVGHSLGGALGTLLAPDLQVALGATPCELVTALFASPHVGSADFVQAYPTRVPNYTLTVFAADAVPWVPGEPFERLQGAGPNHNYISLPRGGKGAPAGLEVDLIENHAPSSYASMLRAL